MLLHASASSVVCMPQSFVTLAHQATPQVGHDHIIVAPCPYTRLAVLMILESRPYGWLVLHASCLFVVLHHLLSLQCRPCSVLLLMLPGLKRSTLIPSLAIVCCFGLPHSLGPSVCGAAVSLPACGLLPGGKKLGICASLGPGGQCLSLGANSFVLAANPFTGGQCFSWGPTPVHVVAIQIIYSSIMCAAPFVCCALPQMLERMDACLIS